MPGRLLLASSFLAVTAAYVLIHEHRKKKRKAIKKLADEPIPKETLLKILHKSAEHSRAVVERIKVEVSRLKAAKNLTDEQAVAIFQQNFEHSLDQLIGAVRQQFGVTEKAMDSSFKIHQQEPDVQAAIQGMRVMSSAPVASSSSSASAGAGVEELTRETLKEVMNFNATLLEKELKPLKERVKAARRQGQNPQVDPQALMALQTRISEQVHKKFGVTDEQVMVAIDRLGAREDPGFKEILQRIANALNQALS